jgi:cytoskeletal protein CcmA (bactofilin family)
MALLTDPQPRKDEPPVKPEPRIEPMPTPRPLEPPRATPSGPIRGAESVLAAGITVEGKIGGTGPLRVAGRFIGDIDVTGELTIEAGARVDGHLSAETVIVAGEVRGNITSRSRVDLRESGVLIGDLKAVSLTVAAGCKMRGQAQFGWKDGEAPPEPAVTKPGR